MRIGTLKRTFLPQVAHLVPLRHRGRDLRVIPRALDACLPITLDQPKHFVKADSIEAAKALGEADPYAKAGLFESVEVKPYNWVFNNPEA